jgi:hypothetical protein
MDDKPKYYEAAKKTARRLNITAEEVLTRDSRNLGSKPSAERRSRIEDIVQEMEHEESCNPAAKPGATGEKQVPAPSAKGRQRGDTKNSKRFR